MYIHELDINLCLEVFQRMVYTSITSLSISFQSRAQNVSGNLSGDGLQNGGLLIVTKGGKQVLLNHREETPGDHVTNSIILETLGLQQINQAR